MGRQQMRGERQGCGGTDVKNMQSLGAQWVCGLNNSLAEDLASFG